MGGFPLFNSIQSMLLRSKREKRLRLAQNWPRTAGEVNHWKIVDAAPDTGASELMQQIEASFHFTVNGEYFGGYVRSVPMVRREAESRAQGTPVVNLRYELTNPDNVAVLAEDNTANLPFQIISN
jgi:hypothetical protein